MKIRQHREFIELVAENTRETKLLRLIFDGISEVNSFGYDRNMPKRPSPRRDLSWWAQRQVLVLKARSGMEFIAKRLEVKRRSRFDLQERDTR